MWLLRTGIPLERLFDSLPFIVQNYDKNVHIETKINMKSTIEGLDVEDIENKVND